MDLDALFRRLLLLDDTMVPVSVLEAEVARGFLAASCGCVERQNLRAP